MRPAFSSTKQAAAFALLLLVLLALPTLMGKNLLPPREAVYSSLGWSGGPYPYIQKQIFEETNDIDIAFMGSSHMCNGLYAPYVQEKLSEKLGRPAVVRSFTWGGSGYDMLYLVAHDLLEHRKVRLLVFYDERVYDVRNGAVAHLFRFGDNASAVSGLPIAEKSVYYFIGLIGMPRICLDLIRSDISIPFNDNQPIWSAPQLNSVFTDAPKFLGALPRRVGFGISYVDNDTPFVSYQPTNDSPPAASVLSQNPRPFNFEDAKLPVWQKHFVNEFTMLAANHHCRLALLNIPVISQRWISTITEDANWLNYTNGDLSMLGIPPAQIFAGQSDDQVRLLYANRAHFNENGMRYFTSLITPALLKLYENPTNH